MKKLIFTSIFLVMALSIAGQVVKDYNPSIQPTTGMQYFKPVEEHLFAGDCMPFYHNGIFYLYWLLDEGHHAGLDGLGGHQWALSTSTDLINWKHYPVALGIDEEWEKSICTGSVIADKEKIYAFYSTRVKEGNDVHEQLSYAISEDNGHSFKKQQPNPFYFAPKECVSRDFRDPRAFKDENGLFHLFISGYQKDAPLSGQGGYLVHLTSDNLKDWSEAATPLYGQSGVPECPDYFKWGNWYYLLYSIHGNTYYVKSKQPYGPWEYPEFQPMSEKWGNVSKTAAFKNGRRIVVSYMNSKLNNKDSEGQVWGGSILLRELFQQKDGSLTVGYLPEVAPAMTLTNIPPINLMDKLKEILPEKGEILTLASHNGISVASMNNLPSQYRITMTIVPKGNYDELGLFLRSTDKDKKGYKLSLNANRKTVGLFETEIESVNGLREPIALNVVVMNDVIDVYINNERCIVNRLGEQKGENLLFFVKNGQAEFKDIKLHKIN